MHVLRSVSLHFQASYKLLAFFFNVSIDEGDKKSEAESVPAQDSEDSKTVSVRSHLLSCCAASMSVLTYFSMRMLTGGTKRPRKD